METPLRIYFALINRGMNRRFSGVLWCLAMAPVPDQLSPVDCEVSLSWGELAPIDMQSVWDSLEFDTLVWPFLSSFSSSAVVVIEEHHFHESGCSRSTTVFCGTNMTTQGFRNIAL